MDKLSAEDYYKSLLQIQKDLKLRNGPTKASIAESIDPILRYLKNIANQTIAPETQSSPSKEAAKQSTATKDSLPKTSPKQAGPQLFNAPEPTEVRSPDTPTVQKPERIYPRLSSMLDLQKPEEEKPIVGSPSTGPKLFSSSSYNHEVSRKERLVNELKRSFKTVSNRETIALVDSHPNWKTLHEFAPRTGIIQVGGLCIPTAAAGLNEISEAQLVFPKATQILLAIGSNDIAHSRCAHHDLHAYSNTWLPYLSRTLSKVFPNASFKFLLPFTSQAVPQTSIDLLQEQIAKAFQSTVILQSPFYAACDFVDTLHLNPSARNQFTRYVAKILTNGKQQHTSLQINYNQKRRILPLMSMKINMPPSPMPPAYPPSQFTANTNCEIPVQPHIQKPPNFPSTAYVPPHPISNQNRTYAQVAASTNSEPNPTHEIINQLTSLLPKLINIINKYQ